MIGPARERDALDPDALSLAAQADAEPLVVKVFAGIILTVAMSAVAWFALS